MANMQGYEGYGGATITRAVDGAGALWIGMCAQIGSDKETFQFRVFKDGVHIPISPVCGGRGSVNDEGWWIAWEDNQYFTGPLPGFVPKAAGGYTVAPNGSIRVFVDQDGFDGQQTIDLASYGIPVCSALNVRLSLDADAGRIFRCGPQVSDPNLQAAAMLTVTGLGTANRAYESGVIGASSNRTLLVKTEPGPIAKGWVDVIGWWG